MRVPPVGGARFFPGGDVGEVPILDESVSPEVSSMMHAAGAVADNVDDLNAVIVARGDCP